MSARLFFVGTLLVALLPQIALAQIKPSSSGKSSFDEPQLRRHRHGLVLPNQPGSPRVGFHRRHHRHHRHVRTHRHRAPGF